MNEKVRFLEYQNKLLDVQKKIDQQYVLDSEEYEKYQEKKEGKEPKKPIKVQIIQPHRVLIFTQSVCLIDQNSQEDEVNLYLTNDMLFWCIDGTSEESLIYKGSINLKKTPMAWVRDVQSDNRMFQVIGNLMTILIKCYEEGKESQVWGEEKKEWMKKIEDVVSKIDFSKEKNQNKAKPTFTPLKETMYLKKLEEKMDKNNLYSSFKIKKISGKKKKKKN
jgi:hypothetical protein